MWVFLLAGFRAWKFQTLPRRCIVGRRENISVGHTRALQTLNFLNSKKPRLLEF